MGLILDSSVLISGERRGQDAREVLSLVAERAGDTAVSISVITLLEMVHGIPRANTPERRQRRERFISELLASIPVRPISLDVAWRAGHIAGESEARGIRIPLADLLIGVTALELGHDVCTENLRDFRMVPGLKVFKV